MSGYWNFNASLLDENFQDQLELILNLKLASVIIVDGLSLMIKLDPLLPTKV